MRRRRLAGAQGRLRPRRTTTAASATTRPSSPRRWSARTRRARRWSGTSSRPSRRSPRSPPRNPRRHRDRAALHQRARPGRPHDATPPLFSLPACRRSSALTRATSSSTRTTSAACSSTPRHDLPGIYNAAGDGVLALSEIAACSASRSRRCCRRGAPASPRRCAPGRLADPARDAQPAALRPRARQPQAQGGRLRPVLPRARPSRVRRAPAPRHLSPRPAPATATSARSRSSCAGARACGDGPARPAARLTNRRRRALESLPAGRAAAGLRAVRRGRARTAPPASRLQDSYARRSPSYQNLRPLCASNSLSSWPCSWAPLPVPACTRTTAPATTRSPRASASAASTSAASSPTQARQLQRRVLDPLDRPVVAAPRASASRSRPSGRRSASTSTAPSTRRCPLARGRLAHPHGRELTGRRGQRGVDADIDYAKRRQRVVKRVQRRWSTRGGRRPSTSSTAVTEGRPGPGAQVARRLRARSRRLLESAREKMRVRTA